MPRKPRFCPPNIPVHIIQRGNNRQICFTSNADIAAYAHWLEEAAKKYEVSIHGWVFMTNHVHLLLTPSGDKTISKLMQDIGRLYVGYFNYTYARSGTLFEGRFRSSLVQAQDYLLTCLHYIELNPVRAGMVKDPGDYRWSSYTAHGFGRDIAMWTPHSLYLSLGNDGISRQKKYRELMRENLNAGVIAKIRHCTNTGLVLGTEKFRSQVQKLAGDAKSEQ